MSRLLRMLVMVVALVGGGFIVYEAARPLMSSHAPTSTSPTTEGAQPASDESFPTPTPPLDAKAIAEEVKALNTKGATQLLRGAGWLHLVARYDSEQDSAGVFPDGKLIPLHYEMDQWFQLKDRQQVTAVIAMMKDLQGQVQQISTFHEGVWRNLTYRTVSEGTAELYLDFHFSQDIEMAAQHGRTITRVIDTSADRSVVHYIIHDNDYDPSLTMAGFANPIIGSYRKATYDSDSGELLAIEIHYLTADNEERVDRTTVLIAEMTSEPPPDILKVLDQEIEQSTS